MAPIGGFLQGLGQQAGYGILQKQETDYNQGRNELQQQQIAANKQDMQMKQQQAEARIAVSADLASSLKSGTARTVDSLGMAKKLEDEATKLLATGDLEGARNYREQSVTYRKQAETEKTQVATELQSKHETTAAMASDYVTAPSAQSAHALEVAYLSTGGDPRKIPTPGSPDYSAWAKDLTMSSMTAADKAKFIQTETDKKEQRTEKAREFDLKREEIALKEKDTRLNQQFMRSEKTARDEERKGKADFAQTEKLNTTMAATAKPFLQDRDNIQNIRGLLAVDTPYGDQQVRQNLTSLMANFKGRATNVYYKDNAHYGDVVNKVSGMLSHGFTGKYTEADRAGLSSMLDQMEKTVVDPALSKIEETQKIKAKKYGLDDSLVELPADFTRTKAPKGLPEGTVGSKVIGGITYYKKDGKWYSQ